MSTMHKFKAYFGMVPLEDYEDDYLDEPGAPRRPVRRDPYGDLDELDYAEPAYKAGYGPSRRDDFDDDPRYEARRPAPRLDPLPPRSTRPVSAPAARATTRGALAVDPAAEQRAESRRAPLFDDGGPLSKITTLRPRDYSEARTIGERLSLIHI